MIRDHNLLDWLGARSLSGVTVSTITGFLENWGLDLQTVKEDHERRNFASYRPGRLTHDSQHISADQICDLLISICEIIEPGVVPGSFPNIDLALLAQIIHHNGQLPSESEVTRGATQKRISKTN